MGDLLLVLPALNLSTLNAGWTSRGDHSEPFLLFEVYCGTPPYSYRVGWVAHEILVAALGPLVLGFWVFGFGA